MSEWHIPDDLMAEFSTSPGEIQATTAASIEQHLTMCRLCQAGMARLSPRSELDAIWAEVQDGVDRWEIGFLERLLGRLRVESGAARLVAATPALRTGAVAAVAFIVAVVVVISRSTGLGEPFLALAPVLPTALVALSFAPGADPAGECGLASPSFGFGLVVRRAAAAEIVALLILAVGSLFVPIDGLRALGWLLPALALSLGTLAGNVRWPAPQAAAGLTLIWVAVLVLAYLTEGGRDLAQSAVFDAQGQVAVGLLAAGACAVTAMNRQLLFQEVNR